MLLIPSAIRQFPPTRHNTSSGRSEAHEDLARALAAADCSLNESLSRQLSVVCHGLSGLESAPSRAYVYVY